MLIRILLFTCAIPLHAANPAYTIPARARSGFRLEVSARVNGLGPFWCTLDSGAGGGFVLDAAAGSKAGLHPAAAGQSFGEGPDAVQDRRVPDATLQLGNLRLPHRTVVMRPLDDGCIVGAVLFDRFVVEIDYLAPSLRLYHAAAYHHAPDAAAVPLTLDQHGRPIIGARLLLESGDAVDARLLLDSGVPDYALSLSQPFIDTHRILQRVRRVIRPPFQARATGGGIDILATRIDRLSVGPLSVGNPLVMLFRTPSGAAGPQPDGLLGSGFLHRFLVAIDPSRGRLYLEPNRFYLDPEPAWPWAADLPPAK